MDGWCLNLVLPGVECIHTGGVLCSLLIRRKTRTVYDGAVFVSPMLEVSADMRPHPIVEYIFRHVLVGYVSTPCILTIRLVVVVPGRIVNEGLFNLKRF